MYKRQIGAIDEVHHVGIGAGEHRGGEAANDLSGGQRAEQVAGAGGKQGVGDG